MACAITDVLKRVKQICRVEMIPIENIFRGTYFTWQIDPIFDSSGLRLFKKSTEFKKNHGAKISKIYYPSGLGVYLLFIYPNFNFFQSLN